MAEDYVTIEACRGCGHGTLNEVLPFGPMPLADGLLPSPEAIPTEQKYPLTVVFCPQCSLVQILENVKPEILYGQDYPYFSSFSASWLEHCRRNALNLIETRGFDSSSLVVEVASNDGYLLKNFAEKGIPTLGIEPTPGPAAEARKLGIEVREEFFTHEYAKQLAAEGVACDALLGCNVLAHVPDLTGFARGIGEILKPEGVAVIEFPYLRDLIDHCEFDTIYHEHHCYFSATSVGRMFETVGLHLNDAERLPTHGGSLRIYFGHENAPTPRLEKLLAEELELGMDKLDYYRTFADRSRTIWQGLHKLVSGLKAEGHRLAAYGAAAKGTTMLNAAGVDHELLDFVVDRNRHKHGRLMPGVHLPIRPAEDLATERPDYTVLLAWNLKKEIIGQQQDYTSAGGKFVVPIPEPHIV